MKKLILASKSNRRIQILKSLKIEFKSEPSFIKETIDNKHLKPQEIVKMHAKIKADCIAKKHKKGIIIAADTLIYKDGKVIGKPHSKSEAKKILNFLMGKKHYIYTGIALIDLYSNNRISDYEKSEIIFRKLSQSAINKYIGLENPCDKAGGYSLEGLGALFYKKIKGCYYNILGLPLPKLEEMLNNLNLSLFNFTKKGSNYKNT